jgi:predicted phage baseplate assembly protein
MPLDLQMPKLDSRTFEDIKRQALLRIPRYTPEWTDFNESDPGITMVELFAWLTETMLYEMNRSPQLSQIKFLQTIGLELQPAEPAEAHLFFMPRGSEPAGPVPEGSQFGAQPPGGGSALFFETLEGLSPISLPLTDVQVFDGAAFQVVTSANEEPGTHFRPFGWQPQPGSALYLGFEPNDRLAAADVFPQNMRWRVFLPKAATAGRPQLCADIDRIKAPAPPVRLSWEYRPDASPGIWRRLREYEDNSLAFTREGSLHIEGPGTVTLTQEGRVADPRYWLRIRLVEGAYPTGLEPEIDFLRPNIARARNLSTVRNEVVGFSDGEPNQVYRLSRIPVAPGTLTLAVEDPEQDNQEIRWQQQDDFYASCEDDPHFVLNAVAGEVRFGDSRRGRIPPAGSRIVAQSYQYGGGEAGNVAADAVTTSLSQLRGIDSVTNPRPAAGGRDEESIDDFLNNAPARLRHRNRAVSVDDFAALAEEVGGIGKAKAIPLFHPSHPGVDVPGAVTLVVIPENQEIEPKPSPDQIEAVCRYLEPLRLLTTELHVKGPDYRPIKVTATVQVEPSVSFDLVASEIVRAINTSLDPLGRDWQEIAEAVPGPQNQSTAESPSCAIKLGGEIGRDLYPTSIYSVIQAVVAVRSISYLKVNGQEHEMLRVPIELDPDELLVGVADHEITIEPYGENR